MWTEWRFGASLRWFTLSIRFHIKNVKFGEESSTLRFDFERLRVSFCGEYDTIPFAGVVLEFFANCDDDVINGFRPMRLREYLVCIYV